MLQIEKGQGNAVRVQRKNAVEIVISDTTHSAKKVSGYGIETDAGSAVVGLDNHGNLKRVYFSDGTYLRYKGKSFKSQAAEGVVTRVNYKTQEIEVAFHANFTPPGTPGSVAHFIKGKTLNVHPITTFTGSGKKFRLKTSDDLILGKVKLKEVFPEHATTETKLPFAELCAGTTILNSKLQPVTNLKHIDDRTLLWTGKPSGVLNANDDVFITDVAEGDRVVLKTNFSWEIGAVEK